MAKPEDNPATPTGVTDEMIREEVAAHGLVRRIRFLRRLYEWILGWAETRYAGKAMMLHAMTEAMFFPVPADVLLIALCLGRPKKSFWWASVCTFWSIVGGTLAMLLGLAIGEAPVRAALDWIRPGMVEQGLGLFRAYGFWTIAIAALTPVPYSICSWLAGFSDVSPWTYLLASVIFRPMRFFAVGGMVYAFGMPAKRFIDKYFELATVLVMLLIIGAALALRYLGKLFGA